MKAVGIHVFAGGFTLGVKKVFDVACQLETHGPFGQLSAENVAGVEWINEPDAKWPDIPADFAYGNPRCTGFSTITAGYDESLHGAWSKQTCDIHQLVDYSIKQDYQAVIWESVQQAASVGRPLLDYLVKQKFEPAGYRVAHVFLNAASFGNTQQRKRYFFVAYKKDKNFNIVPPDVYPYYGVLYDAIWEDRHRETRPGNHNDYDRDTYYNLTEHEWHCISELPNGWNVNLLAEYKYSALPDHFKTIWDARRSDMPFSMHCMFRCNWLRPSPTLHSSCARFIHPDEHRPLTVGELSTIMGWPDIPHGPNPLQQLAKGVCPSAGEWLAEQVAMYLNDEWGDEDWESSYDPYKCQWIGRDTKGEVEKTFNLTRYVGSQFDMSRYDLKMPQSHKLVIDAETGRLARDRFQEYQRTVQDRP